MVGTEAAWVDGKEVVRVEFDPKRVSFKQLSQRAKSKGFFACPKGDAQSATIQSVYGREGEALRGSLRQDKDPKYYLSRSGLRHLPMTELQAVRVNANVRSGVTDALSPRQRGWLKIVEQHPKAPWPDLIGVDPVKGFVRFEKALRAI